MQNNIDILIHFLSFKNFFESFSIMKDITILGMPFGLVYLYFIVFFIAVILKNDQIHIVRKIIIIIMILIIKNYIAWKAYQYPINYVFYSLEIFIVAILFSITYIPNLLRYKILLFGTFLFGNIYFLFLFYTNSINNYEYTSYNTLTYHIDKAETLVFKSSPLPQIDIIESKFKTPVELFRYYYNLSKTDSSTFVRSRLYEIRREISDMDEIVGMSKIVYNTDKFYGRDGDGNFYFCNLNGAEMFKANNPFLLKKQLDLNNTLIIEFNGERYVSDLRKVPCRDIKKENIFPENMTAEKIDHFIEVLGKEVLFADISDDLFNNLREIKKIGEIVRTNVNDKEDRIRMIYKWVSNNIEYDNTTYDNLFKGASLETVFSQIDNKYHSGIMTYKNKVGVCTGYSNLFYLLAIYSGIDNVEVILGKSYDPTYKDYVGHAWNKIGDYFYDTTYESTGNTMLDKGGDLIYYKKTPSEMFNVDKRISDIQKLNPLKIVQTNLK